jgi:predicted MPP superfamily phosphohydrolase
VTQVDRVHPGDIFISVVFLVSQILILRVILPYWKKKLPAWTFRIILTGLIAVWAVAGTGLVLGMASMFGPLRWLPSLVGSILAATEIIWALVSAVAVVVWLGARYLLRRIPAHRPGRRRAIQAATAIAVATPAALCAFGGFIERTRYRVVETDLPIPNLHPDLEGLRISQISDLHVSPFLSVREAARVVDITNELRAALILVTGDLISAAGDPLDATIAELARLRADAGVLGCLGNHEIYAECEDYTTLQARRRGIDFLRLQARALRWGNGVLNIAGVDYQSTHRRKSYLRGADKLIVPGASNLLLSHNPDVFPAAVRQGYDAVVAGHTHGGQVTVEILRQSLNLAKFFTPFVAGLYRMNGRSCYVTAGIGTIGMPVRIGAPPEITLLRLTRAGALGKESL